MAGTPALGKPTTRLLALRRDPHGQLTRNDPRNRRATGRCPEKRPLRATTRSRNDHFDNGITDTYLLSIEGLCAIEDQGRQLEVTCAVGPREYKKHFLGLSDNVTYFAEQLTSARVSTYHYRVVFKPQTIVPDIDFRGSAQELLENSSDSPR